MLHIAGPGRAVQGLDRNALDGAQLSPNLVQRETVAVAGVINIARDDPGRSRGRLQAEAGDILHVGEIARLFAIAENRRRAPLEQAGHKNGEDARIGARRVLPRAIDVEETQADGLEAKALREHRAVVLAHQLLQRVRRKRVGLHCLDLGQHFGVAIGRRRRCVDHAPGAPFLARAQHVEGAVDVGIVGWNRIRDGLRNGRNRRQVEHSLRAGQYGRDGAVVANVGYAQLHPIRHFRQVRLLAGTQIVQHRDASRSGAQQRANQAASDESGSAGDNDFRHIPHLRPRVGGGITVSRSGFADGGSTRGRSSPRRARNRTPRVISIPRNSTS